jgi:PKHD-type hydroxylase
MSSAPPVSLAGNDALALQYRFPSDIRVSEAGVGSLAWRTGQGPFGQTTVASQNPNVAAVQWQPGALTPEECAAVVAAGRSLPMMDGRVELGPDSYRVSHISWIEPQPEHHWLYHKVGALFTQVNRQYGFDIVGLVDALQFTEYGPGQHFHWHMDIGNEQTSLRKLSMTIQLSQPDDYDGGALEFVGLHPMEQSRTQGSATFFPSFMGHRVQPVTRGTRCSLVAWAAGQPYR